MTNISCNSEFVVDSTASRGTSVSLLDMCLLQLNKLYLQRMPQAVQVQ
jgi:hypothetical protein